MSSELLCNAAKAIFCSMVGRREISAPVDAGSIRIAEGSFIDGEREGRVSISKSLLPEETELSDVSGPTMMYLPVLCVRTRLM